MTNIIEVRKIENRINALRVTEFEDWAGETIVAVTRGSSHSAEHLVFFASNKWAAMGARSYPDDDAFIVFDASISLPYDMEIFVGWGLATQEEWQTVKAYDETNRLAQLKQRELAELQRLKEKYETQESASVPSDTGEATAQVYMEPQVPDGG